MDNEKVAYMNIAKGLGIIFVVIGHTFAPFYNFLYMFHMALFFFISGYFYKDKYSLNPRLLIKKRLKSLYLPYVKYMLIFVFLHNLFIYLNIISDKVAFGNTPVYRYAITDYIKNAISVLKFSGSEQPAAAFWFFRVLFAVNVLFCIIGFFINKCNLKNKGEIRFVSVFTLFAIGNIITFLPKHSSYIIITMGTTLVALIVFYFGYLYKKYECYIKTNVFCMIVAIGFLALDCFYGHIEMSTNTYPSPAFFILNSLLGIYVVISFSKIIINTKMKFKLLNYIGENTIIIIALHFLSFKVVNYIQVIMYNYPIYKVASQPVLVNNNGWWILYSIVGVFIPILIKYTIDNIMGIFKNKLEKSKNIISE